MRVGVVSGLPRETACLAAIRDPTQPFDTFAGVGPERAAEGARALLDAGAEGLMSFGVAGGLSGDAAAGTVVLATTVVDGGETFDISAVWRERIRAAIGDAWPVLEAPLAGVGRMVPSTEAKRQLHAETGAAAVDMESQAVARVAAARGVPFCVVRAVSDPEGRSVPKWILRCLTPAGDVRTGAMIWQVGRRPWAWGQVIGLARDSGRAFDALRGVALRLGPGLGLPLRL